MSCWLLDLCRFLLFIVVVIGCETDDAKQLGSKPDEDTQVENDSDSDSIGIAGDSDSNDGSNDNCQHISEEAGTITRPIDIIIIVDNSGSMKEEITAIEANLNNQFADVLFGSGIDYRFILVSFFAVPNYGAYPICIGDPLSPGATCCLDNLYIPDDDCGEYQTEPIQTEQFYHYSTVVSSNQPWCKWIDAYSHDDMIGNFPNGASAVLREEALKAFLVFTDDGVDCESSHEEFSVGPATSTTTTPWVEQADQFHNYLTNMDPVQFGTADDPNYVWYSIVDMPEKDADGTPWYPEDPISNSTAGSESTQTGKSYEQLSIMTGGLRYPISNEDYSIIFNTIAAEVIDDAVLSCQWMIPDSPPGVVFNKRKVNIEYNHQEGVIGFVEGGISACGAGGGWYYDDNDAPTEVQLCPVTCDIVQADETAQMDIVFGCDTVVVAE